MLNYTFLPAQGAHCTHGHLCRLRNSLGSLTIKWTKVHTKGPGWHGISSQEVWNTLRTSPSTGTPDEVETGALESQKSQGYGRS